MERRLAWVLLAVAVAAYGQEPVVQRANLQVEVVKRGDMMASVRGKGKLVTRTTAEFTVPDFLAKYVEPGQTVFLEKPPMILSGKVRKTGEPTVVDLASVAPESIRIGTELVATIQNGKLKDIVYMGQPVSCKPETEGTLFRLEPKGEYAERVTVRYGKYGHLPATVVEIREGLRPGDRVIVSDMSAYDGQERVRVQ